MANAHSTTKRSRATPGRSSQAEPSQRQLPAAGWHFADWACEFVGTIILVLGGLSAVVFDFGISSPVAPVISSHSVRLLLTGLMFAGCGALVAISPLGRRSGAHLNPSITLAFWCQRHLRVGDLFGYVFAQCLGALAGVALLRLIWQKRAASVGYGLTTPGHGIGPWQAAGIEALMTATLVLTIFAFVSSRRTTHWTPLAVWIVVAILVWKGAPYTGTSLNPARSFGPAVIDGQWRDYWIYIVGPLGGAFGAVGCWVLIPRRTLTAKLFHDPHYKSVFDSSLPVRNQ